MSFDSAKVLKNIDQGMCQGRSVGVVSMGDSRKEKNQIPLFQFAVLLL